MIKLNFMNEQIVDKTWFRHKKADLHLLVGVVKQEVCLSCLGVANMPY